MKWCKYLYLPLHKLSEYDNGIQWNYNKYYNSRSIIMENKHGRRMELGNSGMCLHQQIERLLAVAALVLLDCCAVYACNIQSIALETHQNIFICLDGRVGRRTALHIHAKVFLSFGAVHNRCRQLGGGRGQKLVQIADG